MGKTLDELGLKDEVLPQVPVDDIPNEWESAPPPPYPGIYDLKLPDDLTAIWEPIELKVNDDGVVDSQGTKEGQRVAMVFDNESPLVIVNSASGEGIGEPVRIRINNIERNRSRRGDPPVHVADTTYLLKALGSSNPSPKTNKELYKEIVKHAGKVFRCSLEWTTNCNENRQAYWEDQDAEGNLLGGLSPAVDPESGTPINGCGKRYYMSDWPKGDDQRFLPRRTCACGASLRPFAQLRNYKGVS